MGVCFNGVVYVAVVCVCVCARARACEGVCVTVGFVSGCVGERERESVHVFLHIVGS